MIKLSQAFYNSIYLEFMVKSDNSGVVLIWAVSDIRQHVAYRMVL